VGEKTNKFTLKKNHHPGNIFPSLGGNFQLEEKITWCISGRGDAFGSIRAKFIDSTTQPSPHTSAYTVRPHIIVN
jgi:hypothetical protein